jgi:SPP1 family predicted phage head-tail adaptor
MIGKLNRLVTLQRKTETNVLGSLTESWSTVGHVWAYIKTQSGKEAFESARVNATETIRLMMHYREDVSVKWRIIWEGQNYSVTVVDRSERRKGFLWVTAQVTGAR